MIYEAIVQLLESVPTVSENGYKVFAVTVGVLPQPPYRFIVIRRTGKPADTVIGGHTQVRGTDMELIYVADGEIENTGPLAANVDTAEMVEAMVDGWAGYSVDGKLIHDVRVNDTQDIYVIPDDGSTIGGYHTIQRITVMYTDQSPLAATNMTERTG